MQDIDDRGVMSRVVRHMFSGRRLEFPGRPDIRPLAPEQCSTEKTNARFNVVLFPLSLCPSSKTLTSTLFFFCSWRSSLSCSSIESLTCFARCSASSRRVRSTGDSSAGGRSIALKGSESERRRPPGAFETPPLPEEPLGDVGERGEGAIVGECTDRAYVVEVAVQGDIRTRAHGPQAHSWLRRPGGSH